MNAYVTLNGTQFYPASVRHAPTRVSTVLDYMSGKRQEFLRAIKYNFELGFVCDEATRNALMSVGITSSITFVDEFGVTKTVRPASVTSNLVDGVDIARKALFEVQLTLEEIG